MEKNTLIRSESMYSSQGQHIAERLWRETMGELSSSRVGQISDEASR